MATHVRTVTRRDFDLDAVEAGQGAIDGPVYITDGGDPSHVLLSYEHYRRLAFGDGTLGDILGRTPGIADIELELPDRGATPPALALD